MGYFVNSNYIKVYPTAYRNKAYSWSGESAQDLEVPSFNPESRLNSEFNITNITKRLAVKNSFIVEEALNESSDPAPSKLNFCIGGYWFSLLADGITELTTQFSNRTEIYAYIKITALNGTNYSGTQYEAFSLSNLNHETVNILDEKKSGSEEAFQFCGLGFDYEIPSEYPHILLLVKTDNKWRAPASNFFQLTSQEIEDLANPGNPINKIFTTDTLNVNEDASIEGALDVDESLNVGGISEFAGAVNITDETQASGTGSGALVVAGGVLIKKDLLVEGDQIIHGGSFTWFADGEVSHVPVIIFNYNDGSATFRGDTTVGGDLKLLQNLFLYKGKNVLFSVAKDTGDLMTAGSVTLPGITKPTAASTVWSMSIDKDGNVSSTDCTTNNTGMSSSGLKVIDSISQDTLGRITNYTTVNIPTATAASLGLVKSVTTGTTTGRDYNVEVNNDGTMKVNVPWTDTTPVDDVDYESGINYYIVGTTGSGSDADLRIHEYTYIKNDGDDYDTVHSDCFEANCFKTYTHGFSIQAWDNTFSAKVSGTLLFSSKVYFGASTHYIDTSGNCVMTSYDTTSDKRLKENIKEFKPSKSILDLPLVEFDFKDSHKHHIGCIAQDLQKICPEIVHENEDGYLSIEENKLVYLLLDEVKKLKNEIKELKTKE